MIYKFPYGTGEWDAVISVSLDENEEARLKASAAAGNYFLEDDPDIHDIWLKVHKKVFSENRLMMIADGRLDPDDEDADDQVYEELGNYHISYPEGLIS